MSINTENQQTSPLDALQQEVNHVLEHIGRLFAATNGSDKAVPTAHISKLKGILPKSAKAFHDALDQLEDQLQMAQLVMRRDLALCRERTGVHNAPETNGASTGGEIDDREASLPQTKVAEASADVTDGQGSANEVAETNVDVSMQDIEPDEPVRPESPAEQPAVAVEKPADLPLQIDDTVDREMNEEEPKNPPVVDQHPSEKAPEGASALQIDTQPQPKDAKEEAEQRPDEDKEPDTGTFSNANDFDSLFGGPTSAGVDGPDFDMSANHTTEFDFGFDTTGEHNATDNDNNDLSALLPGLQDYANTQPSTGDSDFDAMLNDLPIDTEESSGEQHGSLQHRDSTFDDLMDLTNFDTEDFGAPTGGSHTNDNKDFDFSFDS